MTSAGRPLSRRSFLAGAASAAGAWALAPGLRAAPGPVKPDTLNVALIGAGLHGRDLLTHALPLPGVRFRAVCDIWPRARTYAIRRLRAYKHEATGYEDYRAMLAAERDLDAAIVATPDWVHAEQTIACLEAGLHVYSEKEMATTVADARAMVRTASKTGKLLQVGRQHRSNPRYHRARALIREEKALGLLTHVSGHWHGHKRVRVGWPEGSALPKAVLDRYGYGTMERLRNWRWIEAYSAGPIANLGSHQVDVFNWLVGGPPRAVFASAGLDTYDFFEWYDNLACVWEWERPAPGGGTRVVRGTYEIANTTDALGFLERFIGDAGTLEISEDASRGGLWRETSAPLAAWEKPLKEVPDTEPATRAYGPIPEPEDGRTVYTLHLANFFDSVRGRATLACPGETAFTTTACVLKVNEAIRAGRRLSFSQEDFTA